MFAETIFCNLPYLLLYQKITLIFVKVPKRVGREFFGPINFFGQFYMRLMPVFTVPNANLQKSSNNILTGFFQEE